jgi:hypothetical protein
MRDIYYGKNKEKMSKIVVYCLNHYFILFYFILFIYLFIFLITVFIFLTDFFNRRVTIRDWMNE